MRQTETSARPCFSEEQRLFGVPIDHNLWLATATWTIRK
jgi:hypothetical protein